MNGENYNNYVFHHIPKCGGNSCITSFRNWFRIIPDYRQSTTEEDNQHFIRNKKNILGMSPNDLLCGHFEVEGARLLQRYPEILSNPRYRLITFVRDPIEIAQSLYWYARRTRSKEVWNDPGEAVRNIRNYMAFCLQCNDDNYLDVLGGYWFIGICERMQGSFAVMSSLLGKEPIETTMENISERSSGITTEDVEIFRENNRLDYKIYEESLSIFNELSMKSGLRVS